MHHTLFYHITMPSLYRQAFSTPGRKKPLTNGQFYCLMKATDSARNQRRGSNGVSASTESSAELRAERKARHQMGRRGQRERLQSLVSTDALPALTGRRCVGTVMSGRIFPASKVVPQEFVFPVLVPPRGNEDFFVFRRFPYEKEPRQAMAELTIPPIHKNQK